MSTPTLRGSDPEAGNALLRQMRERMEPDLLTALDGLLQSAERIGAVPWLVGGPVRDILLDRPLNDLDVALEGDITPLVEELTAGSPVKVRRHPRFGTAALLLPGGIRLDLASARTESYPRPGALPEVDRTDRIATDLARRDFTMNAMALRLLPGQEAGLLDPHGGRADLDSGVLRILHPGSFSDDPTRILRAFRFAGRLGLELEPATRVLLEKALTDGALGWASGQRLGREVKALLSEVVPGPGIHKAAEAGMWRALPPGGIDDGGACAEAVPRVPEVLSWYNGLGLDEAHVVPPTWLVTWLVLSGGSDPRGAETRTRFLELGRRAVAASEQLGAGATTLLHFLERPYHGADSALHGVLAPMSTEVLLAAACLTDAETALRRLERFFTRLQGVEPWVCAEDLLALGMPGGPRMGELLERLFHAQLDGVHRDRDTALQAAARLLSEGQER